ncbi:hypothetical protein N7523_004004 [Penicillium sp. IBT 18751x]|nr:hypothetical protein N7523_004004 [Penicillium sp. IBT 18751x]
MLIMFSVDLQRLGVTDNSPADPAPVRTEIVLIGLVAGVVPEEAFDMPKDSDPILIITALPLHVLRQTLRAPSEDPFLDDMIGLVSPFAGVHNLDLTPESPSDANGPGQPWGQLTPSTDGPLTSTSISESESSAVRAYLCEDDIVNAYYIYIHPYMPLLPASDLPLREDCHCLARLSHGAMEPTRADVPYWPNSSLGLALSALLVMIPLSQDPSPMSDMGILVRRSYAQLFAQAALACVERATDNLSPGLNFASPGAEMSQAKSSLHSQVPSHLEPTLALVVLSIYEYCQRGNVSRMRARINQAITTAMDISLHNLGTSKSAHSEAQRRTWWITMFVAYLSSNLHLAPPVVTLDDPRITTPFPQFNVELEPWEFLMQAQKNLFASNQMINSIERMDDTAQPGRSDQIKSLDFQIVSLMTESDRNLRVTFDQQGEASTAENIWRIGRILIFTVRACLATDRLATCYHLLNKPEPATEVSDAERLTEELRHGVELLGASMKADIIFEGVGGMGREIEHAYLAAFPDVAGF